MRQFSVLIATAVLLIAVSGGVSQSHADASLDLVFHSHAGPGVGVCAGGGRNSGNIVAGRAEGIGFGSNNSLCTRPGDAIKGQVLLNVDDLGAPGNADDDGLWGFIYSVVFDEATGGPGGGASDSGNFQDELDLLSANEINTVSQGGVVLAPVNAGVASTQESILGVQRGEIRSFESLEVVLDSPGLKSGGNPYVIGNFTMLVTSNVATDGRDVFVGFFTGNDAFGFNPTPNAYL
jgi:hypothetical protein